jgi:hypothetical protein
MIVQLLAGGGIGFLVGVASNILALLIWFEFDLDHWVHKRRVEHGRKLEEKQKRTT